MKMEEKMQKLQLHCLIEDNISWDSISFDTDEELISIIIPAYNTEKYIAECINSVLHQTYQNFEAIIIDDGSIDDTGRIIDEFGANEKRIISLHQKNEGVSAARNNGLKIAKGKYITFMDSDDYVDPEWLEKRLINMKIYDADMCMCGCDYVRKDPECTKKIHSAQKAFDEKTFTLKLCYMEDVFPDYEITSVCGTLFKREIIDGILFNKQVSIGEDFLFKFEALQRAKKIVCIENKLYKYRIHKTSTMRNGYSKKKTRTIDAFEAFISEHQDMVKDIKVALVSRFVNIAIVILMMIPIGDMYMDDRKRIIEFIDKYKKEVLKNKKGRKKVKISLRLATLVGYDNMQRVFKIISRE